MPPTHYGERRLAEVASWPAAPQELLERVTALIADLHALEVQAYECPTAERMELARRRYAELLEKHEAAPRDPQPMHISNPPSHDPSRQAIEASGVDGDEAVVVTRQRHAVIPGSSTLHQYVFERRRGRWTLVALDFMDHESAWPCL
ncbi:MAG TPA: hypothetical protein RMH85_08835 [Polyangiaceae bacterium LLY-WYZ-15_(1-7)]|nr:hypothetical protein [Sandaracinus sp.]HJK90810.1 hypothetical protein [Polyangiaceae bacterium LLY-WYZ-15_(1-7)]MBJ70356.1 hypothetical protein [Sandaracinus sp.]HJL01392.1 hypothetical protein [Polyangiaceae bacterium LLY-WYZ-15_(1-7)]HJL08589.1 hypothetical protein [Polyangiaceae bacterium LLY-WYZ-15_(1-7)]